MIDGQEPEKTENRRQKRFGRGMVRRSVFCLKSAAFSIPRTEKNPRKSPYYSELLRCVSRGMETTMIDAKKNRRSMHLPANTENRINKKAMKLC